MVRLNDGAGTGIAQETIDALRRRYIRQNRELAKTNSLQAQRIHDLEEELGRIISENHTIRAECIGLERRAGTAERVLAQVMRTKAVLEDKLSEVRQLIGGLCEKPMTTAAGAAARGGGEGECADSDNIRRHDREWDRERDVERDREAREARFQMVLERMPTIDEDREFHGVTVGGVADADADADAEGVEDGVDEVDPERRFGTHLEAGEADEEIEEEEVEEMGDVDEHIDLDAHIPADPVQVNLAVRARRKESRIVVYNEAAAEAAAQAEAEAAARADAAAKSKAKPNGATVVPAPPSGVPDPEGGAAVVSAVPGKKHHLLAPVRKRKRPEPGPEAERAGEVAVEVESAAGTGGGEAGRAKRARNGCAGGGGGGGGAELAAPAPGHAPGHAFGAGTAEPVLVEEVVQKENLVGAGSIAGGVVVGVSGPGSGPRKALGQKSVNEVPRRAVRAGAGAGAGGDEKVVKPAKADRPVKGAKAANGERREKREKKPKRPDGDGPVVVVGEVGAGAGADRFVQDPGRADESRPGPDEGRQHHQQQDRQEDRQEGREEGQGRRTREGRSEEPPAADPPPARSRRTRATINYAEPSLVKKLRRPAEGAAGSSLGLLFNINGCGDGPNGVNGGPGPKHGDVRRKSGVRSRARGSGGGGGDGDGGGADGGADESARIDRAIEDELERLVALESPVSDRR